MSTPNNYTWTERVFDEDDQKKHLDYLQTIITRMNTNSFMIKGWAITITTALLTLTAAIKQPTLLYLVPLPVLAFWILDAIYLWQERKLRVLYNDARSASPQIEAYEINIEHSLVKKAQKTFCDSLLSSTIGWFYAPLAALTILAACIVYTKTTTPDKAQEINMSIKDTIKIQQVKSLPPTDSINRTRDTANDRPEN